MRKIIFIAALLLFARPQNIISQSLSINTDGSTANASAMLDVKSTTKGLLIPRMTRTERNTIASPATGLMIFQSGPDSVGLYYYSGTTWTWIFANSNADSLAWRTRGNTGTVDANNFIGTTDNVPLNFKVFGQHAGRIDNTNANTFFGYQAGNANIAGGGITAYGYQALFNNLASNNTAIGGNTLYSNTTGSANVATGTNALSFNTIGGLNTASGIGALYNNVAGSNATAVGYNAMVFTNNTTTPFTNSDVAVGYEALRGSPTPSANTGNFNTASGYQTLWSISSGNNNSAVGYRALYSNSTGDDNTATGTDALYSNTASYNTANGFYAMRNNTLGTTNTAIGATALYFNTTAGKNTAIGYNALYTQSFSNGGAAWNSQNTAIGDSALFYNQPTTTSNGSFNTAVGNQSLRSNTTGYQNTVLGNQAGYGLTAGSNNVFIGYQAGYNETTGSNKLYIANSSSNPPLIYGDFSTARIGLGTVTPAEKLEINGNLLFTGTSTIYSGTGTNLSLRPGDGTGSGGSLTIRGGNAGIASGGAGGDLNLTGGANLPSGGAGYGGLGVPGNININGSYGYNSVGGAVNIKGGATSCWSLVSGSHADVNITGGINLATTDAASIVVQGGYTIGTSCPPPGATGGNIVIQSGLGSGTGTTGNIQLLNGNVGIGTSAPSSKLEVCGNTRIIGTLNVSSTVSSSSGITCPSDIRYKQNISPLKNSLNNLVQLQGVNYYWKVNEFPNMNFTDKMQMGFIAQDVEKIFPEMVFTDVAGYKSIDYSRLTPVLVETIKEQQQIVENQQKAIDDLLKRVEKLEHK